MKYQNFLGKGFTVQFIDSTAMKQMLVHVRLMKNVFELNLFKMFQSELIKLVNESFYVVLIGHTMQSFINRIVCCEILPFDKKKTFILLFSEQSDHAGKGLFAYD